MRNFHIHTSCLDKFASISKLWILILKNQYLDGQGENVIFVFIVHHLCIRFKIFRFQIVKLEQSSEIHEKNTKFLLTFLENIISYTIF